MGSAALWQCALDVPTRLSAGPQSENDPGMVSDAFSGFHLIGGMATVLTRLESDGLQRVVDFWRLEPVLNPTRV